MNERRTAVRGIIYKNNQILAVQHKAHDGTPVNFWATPGGGTDPGESITAAIHREMVEETGIIPKVGRLLFTQQFTWLKHTGEQEEQLEFFYLIENVDDYRVIDLEATSHGHVELVSAGFVSPQNTNLLPTFLQTIDLEDYILNIRPVEHFDYL